MKEHKYKCVMCNKIFISKETLLDANRICSKNCQEKFNKKYPLIGNCIFCEKSFHKKKSFTKFCSYICKRRYNEDRIPTKEYKCSFCGGNFFSTYHKRKENAFCSRDCYHSFCVIPDEKKTGVCENCNQTFIKKYKQQRLCSEDCQHKW